LVLVKIRRDAQGWIDFDGCDRLLSPQLRDQPASACAWLKYVIRYGYCGPRGLRVPQTLPGDSLLVWECPPEFVGELTLPLSGIDSR
jgi:hypothetical protein